MKAVLHYRASPGFQTALRKAGQAAGVQTAVVDETDEEGLYRELKDTSALLHILKPVTSAMMGAAPKLQLIQKVGVGVNTIDLEAAKARKIAVCNMPGSNGQAVAELTLSLMLDVLRRTKWLDQQTRAGSGWAHDFKVVDGFGEIAGRTVGFVGFGAIPNALAPALEALGAKVIYTARTPRPGKEAGFRDFEALLSEADIVSLHAPLTQETAAMMNEAAFNRMRPGSVLINTARGRLVDELALAAALKSGRLNGAGLDVFAEEPIPQNHPLAGFDTVVMTPHVGWLTPETLNRSLGIAMENVARLERGEPLLHRVV